MIVQKSTRYALLAAIELARAWPRATVSAAEVADGHSLPPTVVAKVVQRLVRGGLARGSRGVRGGYRLARDPRGISVLDVIDAFERTPRDVFSLNGSRAARADASVRRLKRLFEEVGELERTTYASISLATLVGSPPLLRALRFPG